MKCEEIIRILEEQSPNACACDWDNTGLLVGDRNQEIEKIYITLDADDEAIDEAVKLNADLILTHHPIIFKGLKQICADDFIGRKIIKLNQNYISCYAMHTNFDVRGMAELTAERLSLKNCKVLDVTAVTDGAEEGIGRVGDLEKEMSLEELAVLVREAFALEQVKVFGNPSTKISYAAISGGSGKSEIENAIKSGAQALITGDIDHHSGIDAVAQGLCIIDAGHYGLEHIFVSYMKDCLEKNCDGVQIFTKEKKFPFWVI